jgi:tRNA wybutosine-synthesizing protein 2
MASFALRVEKKHAEVVRVRLLDHGLFDRSRLIIRDGDFVEIPVVGPGVEGGEGIDFEVVQQGEPAYNEPDWSFEAVKEYLVRVFGPMAREFKGGWELMGDILIVSLPESLEKEGSLVGERLLDMFPRVRTVINRKSIREPLRRPDAEIMAGDRDTLTVHKENGCLFNLDPLKVMFSAGNVEERRRMASISCPKETVVDLFAGIGQFTIPMAVHSRPERITAIEKRETTFRFLKENIRLNGLTNVTPVQGDCREVAPRRVADRVLMGYIFDMPCFLPTALRALRPEGGTIHYHDLVAKKDLDLRGKEITKLIEGHGWEAGVSYRRLIKSYSPARWHAVYDIEVRARSSGPSPGPGARGRRS